MTSPDDRKKALQILDEGMAAGARAQELALLLGVGLSTLQRWRRQFAGQGCLKVDSSAVLGELSAAQPQHPFDVVGQRAQTAAN